MTLRVRRVVRSGRGVVEEEIPVAEVPLSPSVVSRLRAFSRAAGVLAVLVGLLVLVGWAFEIPIVTSVLPGFTPMVANTAVSFILAGVSLLLLVATRPTRRPRALSRAAPSSSP